MGVFFIKLIQRKKKISKYHFSHRTNLAYPLYHRNGKCSDLFFLWKSIMRLRFFDCDSLQEKKKIFSQGEKKSRLFLPKCYDVFYRWIFYILVTEKKTPEDFFDSHLKSHSAIFRLTRMYFARIHADTFEKSSSLTYFSTQAVFDGKNHLKKPKITHKALQAMHLLPWGVDMKISISRHIKREICGCPTVQV